MNINATFLGEVMVIFILIIGAISYYLVVLLLRKDINPYAKVVTN